MRILSVIHFPVFGGPHNQALQLADPLSARGFRTLVVIPNEPGNAADRLRAGGVEVIEVPLSRLRATTDLRRHAGMVAAMPGEIQRLRRLIRSERIDIAQIGGLVNPHAAIAARLEHVPVVWQLLDTRAPRPVASAAMVWVRELADVIMSTGSTVAESHPGYAAIADRVVPFFPPVDLDRFTPHPELRADVRAEWGVALGDAVVGCVANINPQKGIVDLVRAFATVRAQHPDSRLVLVGTEYPTHLEYSAAVRRQMTVGQLIEGHDVIFVGGRDDVERQLAGMDVVALAAVPRSEGITTAILEAMAVGLPVVVTNVGGLHEAVTDGRTGFVIQQDDMVSFANAITRLLDDPALRARMGQAGRLEAVTRFGVETCADAHVRAYMQALGRRGMANRVPSRATEGALPIPTVIAKYIEGLPVFVGATGRVEHDELDHRREHKAVQAAHFDRVAEEEFETRRPHGEPRLYRFLLAEKLRRAVAPIGSRIVGASALVVCGGSGMDAEYLARAGANVATSDLSLGAAKRARDRASNHHLRIQSVVADVEHLPYADQSVDLVSVHDGLHHLDDPYAGLAEMVRVARRWVVVTEPARASVTRLAVRLGLALETEEAGNRVERMVPSDVAAYLEARGFVVLRGERYAMYYPHRPGAVFRFLSRPFVYQGVRVGWRVINAIVGRFGNKMVVVAERAT